MTATKTANRLSPAEQKELAEARAKISIVEDEAQQYLDEHARVHAAYNELLDIVAGRRAELDKLLPRIRERYLHGAATFEDLTDTLRDVHELELLEADLKRQHDVTGMTEWGRLVRRPQARAVNANAGGMHSRRVAARLMAKAESKP